MGGPVIVIARTEFERSGGCDARRLERNIFKSWCGRARFERGGEACFCAREHEGFFFRCQAFAFAPPAEMFQPRRCHRSSPGILEADNSKIGSGREALAISSLPRKSG